MPGREQHPPSHPELEVGRDRNPVKTPPRAEAGAGRTEDEGRVALRVLEVGDSLTAERPPAKAARKKSGKISAGNSSAGVVKTRWRLRQATPSAAEKYSLARPCSSSHHPVSQGQGRDRDRDHDQGDRDPEGEGRASPSQP